MISIAVALVFGTACDLVDPARSTVQADADVFGNLLEAGRSPDDPSQWIVRIQAGVPRALRAAEEEIGRPTPTVEKGLMVTVTVGPDAIVVAGDRPVRLDEIDPGTEVVVIPVAGTTRMLGSTDLHLEAATLMDFATFRRWRLPNLASSEVIAAEDPALINSGGVEIAPVPVGDGGVLYFTAHLRPPAKEGDGWHGAQREGLLISDGDVGARERSFRTELAGDGWTRPELVQFPGLEEAARVRVTWVDDDETACLVSVTTPGELSWIGRATRSRQGAAWSTPERIESLGDDAQDGVYLTGSRTKIVFVSMRGNRDRSDLFLFDPKNEDSPMPLEPQICTIGSEWSPRTGPKGELFFCREDRQLIFKGGQVRPLRLPGPHRILFTQAAPTSDGRWIFFCMPKYRPLEPDHDIYVSPIGEDLSIGEPVPVDDWRP
jgi:hypothetical protein